MSGSCARATLWTTDDVLTWLREALAEQGLSHQDLAQRIGCSNEQLSNVLHRRRTLSESCREAVPGALGLAGEEAQHLQDLLTLLDEDAPVDHDALRERIDAGRRWARAPRVGDAALIGEGALGALARRVMSEGGPTPALAPGAAVLGAISAEARALGLEALGGAPRERHLEMMILAMSDGLRPAVRQELRALRARVIHRCDRAREAQAGALRPYVLLLQMVPLSRRLEERPGEPAIARGLRPRRTGSADVLRYTDYVAYLNDVRDQEKALADEKGAWTNRWITAELNRRLSPGQSVSLSLVGRIFLGDRHIHSAHLHAWQDLLGLEGRFASHFSQMVTWRRAGAPEVRARAWAEIEAVLRQQSSESLDSRSARFQESWCAVAVLELALHPSFVGDPAWVADSLTPPITVGEAADALARLEDLGLLARDPQTKALRRAPEVTLHVPPIGAEREIARRMWSGLNQALSRSLPTMPDEEVEIGLSVLAIPQDLLSEVRDLLTASHKRLQGLCDAVICGHPGDEAAEIPARAPQPPDRVMLLTWQLFPLALT